LPPAHWVPANLGLLRIDVVSEPSSGTVLGEIVPKLTDLGGTVIEYGQRSVLAAFGLPPAEDAAERAAVAALAIDQIGRRSESGDAPSILLKITIHSGVFHLRQAPHPVPPSVTMDVQEKSAALAQLDALAVASPPGSITVSSIARRQLERVFEFEALGADAGSGAPPGRLVASRRTGRPPTRRALSSLVSRDSILSALHTLLDRAEQGSGHVVGLAGVPGVGKSRLVHEFRARAAGRAVAFLHARCVSYRASKPYFPVRELLRDYGGIGEFDSARAIQDALAEAIRRAGCASDPNLAYLLDLFGLSLPEDPLAHLSGEARQAGTFALLRDLLLAGSRRLPQVLVVEDIHWADPTSLKFLEGLVESIPEAGLLLLLTYRPPFQPPLMTSSHVTQIAVPPLSAGESRTLVNAILGAARVPPSAPQIVVKRADGNPLFLGPLSARASSVTSIRRAATRWAPSRRPSARETSRRSGERASCSRFTPTGPAIPSRASRMPGMVSGTSTGRMTASGRA
jgi:hypothetical protein